MVACCALRRRMTLGMFTLVGRSAVAVTVAIKNQKSKIKHQKSKIKNE
jgi:hypothetical protein